ncbi:Hypp1369 [Branchiostoma lanceolatum]|uniref:Hypp1369 protein n=1 Tax=Branchiostoma lanceolatum TaxID=7740 RepID=A0A8J9ZIZ8_BRALA|nr:Hypp1369 [Branchiostoma lanceolatum]
MINCCVISAYTFRLLCRGSLGRGTPWFCPPRQRKTTSHPRVITPARTCAVSRSAAAMAAAARAPARIGDPISDIDTPALVVDLEKLHMNLKIMPQSMSSFGSVAVRPHAKAHKCATLALLQVSHGAVGMCAQTLTEAEAMVYGGVQDVLVSNQIIGRSKLLRFATLAHHAKMSVCVDNEENIRELSNIAKELNVNIGAVVEVNVGQDSANQHVRKAPDRKAATDSVVEKSKIALKALEDAGIKCDYVTGGGTGTYLYEAGSGVFTEVQPGSYVFMDADYGRNFGEDGQYVHQFHQSLYVLATVQSITAGNRAVVDAGMKAVSLDSGEPLVHPTADVIYHCGGDEHGILRPPLDYKVGDKVWLIPGHCDPTVNLYDWMVGIRNDKVESLWQITGRGPGI